MQLRVISTGLVGFSALLAAPGAHAQTDPSSLERTIPKFEVTPAEKQPRVPAHVLPHPEGMQVEGKFVLGAVNIEGATVFSSAELAQSFEPYLASTVGQAELDKIVADITSRYRRAGYLLSYAVLPEQSVQSGIVNIRVVEGYIGNVRIEGDRRTAGAIRAIVERLSAERPLRTATLERALGLIRDLPGVLVRDTTLSRSPNNSARHALTIKIVSDSVRGVVYADNRGTIEGARIRGYSSVMATSLAVPGDQLQLDLFAIPGDDFRFIHGLVKASVPLSSDGLRLTASASRGDQVQRVEGPNQHGETRQLLAELAYPFVKSRAFSLVGHASLSDWKSDEERAGTTLQRDRLQVLRAWAHITRLARTRIDSRIGISRGVDLGPATERGDPLASRPFAGGTFTKFNVDLQVAAPLHEALQIRLDTSAQYSTKPLLASEEFALGGSRIGRAFDFNAATGDHGVGAMLELSYRIGDVQGGPKALELFGYADGGGAFRKRSMPGLAKHEWIAGVGGGARFAAFGMAWSGEIGIPADRADGTENVRAFFSVARGL